MTRAITAGELALLRSEPQAARFGLAISQPATVYTAVSSTMTSNDAVAYCGYSTGSGTLADVQIGMTMYIGSAAGLRDLGVVRIRKAPTANMMYFSEISDVDWTVSRYLTVVNEYAIWPRSWRQVDNDPTHVKMDYDLAYSDQHKNFDPIANLGPDRVLYQAAVAGGTPITLSPSAAGSSCYGSSISSYLWSVYPSTGASITNETTATPTFSFTTTGERVIACTVTAANGKTTTGRRSVFVFDMTHLPYTDFSIGACEGSMDAGGWSFAVTPYTPGDIAKFRDMAKVILFALDERYGATAGSLGPVTGAENIVCAGYVDGASINRNAIEGDALSVTVQGPSWWLNKIYALPAATKYVAVTPTSWVGLAAQTVDRAVWSLLHWRCTLSTVCDLAFTGSTKLLPTAEGSAGSLWQQVAAIGMSILARPACDRYGSFYLKVDPQWTAVASRTTIPVVMTVTTVDFTPPVTVEYQPLAESAVLDGSGVSFDGATTTPLMTRGPGHAPKAHGGSQALDGLLASTQADLNAMAGLYLGWLNNIYPATTIPLAANNRFFDITPPQYFTLDLDDSPASSYEGRYVPRTVSFAIDTAVGQLTTQITGELETLPENAVTIPVPVDPNQPNFPVQPEIGDYKFLPDLGKDFPSIVINDGSTPWVDPLEDCNACRNAADPGGDNSSLGNHIIDYWWKQEGEYPSAYGWSDANALDPWRALNLVGFSQTALGDYFFLGGLSGYLIWPVTCTEDSVVNDLYLRRTDGLSPTTVSLTCTAYMWDTKYHEVLGVWMPWWHAVKKGFLAASLPPPSMTLIINTTGEPIEVEGTIYYYPDPSNYAFRFDFTLPSTDQSYKVESIQLLFSAAPAIPSGWDESGEEIAATTVAAFTAQANLPKFLNSCVTPKV